MFKIIATDAVISKGYNDKPALSFSEDGSSVRFRIGKSVYDKRAENDRRWINISVKAFGALCERIQKMKLDAGSYVHIEGRYDEDTWDDDNGKHSMPVIIVDGIEYAYSGNGNGNGNGNKQNGGGKNTGAGNPAGAAPAPSQAPQQQNGAQTEMPDSFTGFESYGGANPFFPQGQS
jgi:single-stranded DNA-binding protein